MHLLLSSFPQISDSSPSLKSISPMSSPILTSSLDFVLNRLGKLSIPSPLLLMQDFHPSRPFEDQSIDPYSPRPNPYELSPASSIGSDSDYSLHDGSINLDRASFEAFTRSRSRVVRFFNLPTPSTSYLASIFCLNAKGSLPLPTSIWALRDDTPGLERSVWAIYKSHEEACIVLSLSTSAVSAAPALESELEAFQRLRRVDFQAPILAPASASICFNPSDFYHHHYPRLRMSASVSDLQRRPQRDLRLGSDGSRHDFPISTNPPNPKAIFRLGDWICGSPGCAAHNFGRNLACIGCGCPRQNAAPMSHVASQATRLPSPRFTGSPTSSSCFNQFSFQNTANPPVQQPMPTQVNNSKPSAHPLLTPSGRAFASGGKVQNVSSDPLLPCVMYWPDNEPLPEQGQIRPSGLVGVAQPPILNTGNRGPIEHQPGDWICLKCNYLNWRRRKVCQTCFPYAEGNGDSISAAVQAERISLLTSALARTQSIPPETPLLRTLQRSATLPPQLSVPRAHSLTPSEHYTLLADISPSDTSSSVPRSQSQFDLGAQYSNASLPIYQTSGYPSAQRQSSQPFLPSVAAVQPQTPAPLLPSFLQDIVQSPTLSPTSTSSADLSFDEYEVPSPQRSRSNASDSSLNLSLSNIWRLDGEESKTLSSVALPNRQDLVGAHRSQNRELFRQAATA